MMTMINNVKPLATFNQRSKKALTAIKKITLASLMLSGVSMAQQATNLDDLLLQLE